MRHQPEPLAQPGFGVRPALGDLVAEHPGADDGRADAVAHPVDGEALGGAAGTEHPVDPDPGPGDEPEAAVHAALLLVEIDAGALPRLPLAARLAEVGPTLLAGPLDLAAHLEPDPVADSRARAPDAARRPATAACTTVSRSTMSANNGAGTVSAPVVEEGALAPVSKPPPRPVMTYSRSSRTAGGCVDQALDLLDLDPQRLGLARAPRPGGRAIRRRPRTSDPHEHRARINSRPAATAATAHTGTLTSCITAEPYPPRIRRRIRSQRSLTAASAPRDVGW